MTVAFFEICQSKHLFCPRRARRTTENTFFLSTEGTEDHGGPRRTLFFCPRRARRTTENTFFCPRRARRTTENTFFCPRRARRTTENTFFCPRRARRTTENTFFCPRRARRTTENTSFVHGGPRRTPGAYPVFLLLRSSSGFSRALLPRIAIPSKVNESQNPIRGRKGASYLPASVFDWDKGARHSRLAIKVGRTSRVGRHRGALRGVSPRTREGRRPERQWSVVSG